MFITFEGIDGCGKTTQSHLLKTYLDNQGYSCLLTREPGGTTNGEKIRELLLSKYGWQPMTEVLLVLAARCEHYSNLIQKQLELGGFVICDRFFDSTVAYQGYGRGLDVNVLKQLQQLTLKNVIPDLTFMIDIDPKSAADRAAVRSHKDSGVSVNSDTFESMDESFFQKVRSGFLSIGKAEQNRCHIIDGKQSEQNIHNQIIQIIKQHLKLD